MPRTPSGMLAATVQRLQRATGQLSSAAISRMDETLPWYRALPADERSWVGLVAQAGITSFIKGLAEPQARVTATTDVFGAAPRQLARAITLQQTVELVRTAIDVVDDHLELVVEQSEVPAVRDALLRYAREVAFATAEVYAQAAESRGGWDARLEALVVDALLRGEADDALRSRAAALGWPQDAAAAVVVGSAPDAGAAVHEALSDLHRLARSAGGHGLVSVQGDRLVVVLAGVADVGATAKAAAGWFGPGPVVVGSAVPGLAGASRSARTALAGLVAARAWPDAPRPVAAADLLPERVLSGDVTARRAMVDLVYRPLADAGGSLLDTLGSYLRTGGSLEATARALFVHPNTVRYRLKRVSEICGWTPANPRERFVLQVALALGRLAATPSRPTPIG